MEAEAIYIGLNLHYFWSLTPKQYAKYSEIYIKKENERLKETDALNHILGKYIAWAFNDPQNYPKKPFVDLDKEDKIPDEMPVDELEKMARKNTIILGGVVNDDRAIRGITNG